VLGNADQRGRGAAEAGGDPLLPQQLREHFALRGVFRHVDGDVAVIRRHLALIIA
jgi:hypothetical protein